MFGIKEEIIIVALFIVMIAAAFFVKNERDIGYNRAQVEYAKKYEDQVKEAKNETDELQSKIIKAQDNAKERDKKIQELGDSNSLLSKRLSDTIRRFTSGVPNDPSSAGDKAITIGELFNDCQQRYQSLATDADEHASDTIKLKEAWPK